MAIRVLATFPELPAAAESVMPVEAVAPLPRPASPPAQRRVRASFPGVSVATLAVAAAAIWSLVALREATRSGPEPGATRIAREPVDAGAPEMTRQ